MTIETTRGTMVLELYPDKAPITVAAIAELAEGSRQWIDPGNGMKMENEPYYDDIVFHRVIPSFMIQAGDPLGKGYGGPGFEFQDEFSEDLTFDRPGRLAMANPGRPNSNGGQFFITVAPTPQLNFKHTIFGQVIEGQDIAVAISKVPRDGGDKPRQDVIIQSMTIHRE
ncbi:MAG: peptidylprolyl isomerase [Candidatus Latescibacteria bacterium]|nr:peptidylprolyl isomerase [Candidatus Latescibacterota bacterium]